jgi:ATP-dependent RNA helicase DHX57
MYEADPFLAHQEVKKRQAKATERREGAATSSSSTVDVRKTASSNEFSQSLEVRMATSLRELVEDAIKEASYSLFTRKKDTKWRDLGTFS